MSVTITLPEVSACEATKCTYNTDRRCHAPAITIGDSVHPTIDVVLDGDEPNCTTFQARSA